MFGGLLLVSVVNLKGCLPGGLWLWVFVGCRFGVVCFVFSCCQYIVEGRVFMYLVLLVAYISSGYL